MAQPTMEPMFDSQRDSTRTPHDRVTWRQTFSFARDGVMHAFVHERNMRVHLAAAYTVLAFCVVTRPRLGLVVEAALLCFLVLAAEVFNTAIESLTDLVTNGQPHPLAKVAKDAAAGGVLLTSIAAACMGFLVIAKTYPWHFLLFTTSRPAGAVFAAVIMLILAGFQIRSRRFRSFNLEDDVWTEGRRRRPE